MFERLQSGFAQWWSYRTTLYELGLLDRHILIDAGIDPCAIRDHARAATRARAKAARAER